MRHHLGTRSRPVLDTGVSLRIKGTVLQDLQRTFIHVITSVADPGCLSIPDPASEFFPSRIRIKQNLRILTPKKLFLSSQKYDPDSSSRIVHYGSRSRIQGSKRHRIPDADPQQPCSEHHFHIGIQYRIRRTNYNPSVVNTGPDPA